MMHPLAQKCWGRLGRGLLVPAGSLGSIARQGVRSPAQKSSRAFLPLWLTRRNHNASSSPPAALSTQASPESGAAPKQADAIVIGGGPAGIAAVGNLLDHLPDARVVWVDRSFEGGAISTLYREIPSYSPVEEFLGYARALETFRKICDAAPKDNNPLAALEMHPPGITCMLNHVGDMLKFLTQGLLRHERVEPIMGTAWGSRRGEDKQWTVSIEPGGFDEIKPSIERKAPIVIYCTGCRPSIEEVPREGVQRLPLETGFSPTELAKVVPEGQERTFAVIGDSHSAVLVLRNLFHLTATSNRRLQIRWFTRNANLVYAQPTEDGVVLNENTGLKGEAARFALTQLEGDMLKCSDAGTFIKRFILPENASAQRGLLERQLEGVDYVFQAIGFRRNRIPRTLPGLSQFDEATSKLEKKIRFNPHWCNFHPRDESERTTIGLFGAGIAFPEVELTSSGAYQPAVGIWKFMKFLQTAVPHWVESVRTGRKIHRKQKHERTGKRPPVFTGVRRVVLDLGGTARSRGGIRRKSRPEATSDGGRRRRSSRA